MGFFEPAGFGVVFVHAVKFAALALALIDGVGQAMGAGDGGVIAFDAEALGLVAELVGALFGEFTGGHEMGVTVLDGGAGH